MRTSLVLVSTAVASFLAACGVSYERAHFNVNGERGFHVYAVTIEKEGIVHTHYTPIRMQHTVSGPDGRFSLQVPSKGDRYFTEIYLSKPGFRFDSVRVAPGSFFKMDPRSRSMHIRIRPAGSVLEEETAILELRTDRHLTNACRLGKWPNPCRAYAQHVAERESYFKRRYPEGTKTRRPAIMGRVPVVGDWAKLRPFRHPVGVVTAGEHIVVREVYLEDWYVEKYGQPAKDLMYLRHHPHLRREENLVLLGPTGKVLFETPIPSSAWGAVHLAPMSTHEVAILHEKGDLKVFDTRTLQLRAALRLESVLAAPTGFAVSPSLDTIFVVFSGKVLHQYDGAGKLIHQGPVKELLAAKHLAVTPGKECLISGDLVWDKSIRVLRLDDLWATGSMTGVLRVGRGPQGWSVSWATHFVSAFWATDEGFWVYRAKLIPHAFYSLPQAERLARHSFRDFRYRLYLYSYEGKLLRSVDQTDVICAPPGTSLPDPGGLVTTAYLGIGRCGIIDRLLLRPPDPKR